MQDDQTARTGIGQRRLAVIVFTDVVSYSALVLKDETRTIELVRRDLAMIQRVCQEVGGQVLKNTGDGLLMIFDSADAAVTCALKVRAIIDRTTAKLPPDQVLQHRVGIHLGDVILQSGDVLGNGVNIAARVMAEAPPGGICVTQTVYDVIKHRPGVHAEPMGLRQLKNIAEPVPIFVLGMGREPSGTIAPPSVTAATGKAKWAIIGGAAAILLVVLAMLGIYVLNARSPVTPSPAATQTPPTPQSAAPVSVAPVAAPVPAPAPAAVAAPVPTNPPVASNTAWRDLLRGIDPAADAVSGQWTRADDGLTCRAMPSSRLSIRGNVPREYDLRVEFTRRSGMHSVAVMFVAGTGTATFELDCWGTHLAGIQNVNGLSTRDGERGRGENVTLVNDKRYSALVEVRRNSVTGYLDDQRIVQLQTNGSDLALWNDWRLPGRTLGVGAYNAETTFHKIEMREVN